MAHIKKIVYYVPPCPACGSRDTGHYVRRPVQLPFSEDSSYSMLQQCVLHGERIRFRQQLPAKNCFCHTCGNEWTGQVEEKWMTKKEIMREIKARNLLDPYNYIKKEKKAEQNKIKHDKWRRVFPMPFR